MLVKIRRRGMYRKTRRWECQRGSGIDGFPTNRVQPTTATWFTKAAIVLSGLAVAGTAWAQCGITQSCISPPPGILPPITSLCEVNMCFSSRENRERYERENNCIFPDNSLCGGKKVDSETQCCVKDARTQKSKIRQKQYTKLDKSFDWNSYKQECVDMQQSEAPPDSLWRQCVVGQPHANDDDYAVMKVESNGNARSYCIDGCSTPPSAIKIATSMGYFIFPDRNNPTGGGAGGIGEQSSFLAACSNHDRCYQTCSESNQENCDDSMLADMQAVCRNIPTDHETRYQGNLDITRTKNTLEACISAAEDMHSVLRKFGSGAFNNRRQQYCQCC